MQVMRQILEAGLIVVMLATTAVAKDVKIFCDKNDKSRSFYQEAAAIHIIGHVECGEKVTVLYKASDTTAYRILRKTGEQGYVFSSAVSGADKSKLPKQKTYKAKTGPSFWDRLAAGMAAAGPAAGAPPQTQTAKLMIFGGDGHRVYLGCLNCSEYASDSVKNTYGTHGSAYSSESIFNHYSEYGSPYSSESACNQYATDPPVIVDEGGRYYGRLTLNRYNTEIGAGTQLIGWLAAVCQN